MARRTRANKKRKQLKDIPDTYDPEYKTIGVSEYCWCGKTLPHWWNGKSKGAPHPR